MTPDTAKRCIDWIFAHVPSGIADVEINFIGGEPLLEFGLIKEIIKYACSKSRGYNCIFFATTNGTLLTSEMKAWFAAHKDCFWLGLSLDGAKETQDHNRSNSFDLIDTDFFIKNWPEQGVKMTLSEFSLTRLAENIRFIHSLGFRRIEGVNLFEGSFDWDRDEYIKILTPQLYELVNFYIENDALNVNQMLDKHLDCCGGKEYERRKWCGIGTGTNFFDVDGTMYPCTYVTPMTFNADELDAIQKTDFTNDASFIDEDCLKNCYIYPICPSCAGSNYLNMKTFKTRDKRKCRIQKLIALFIADLQGRRIKKNPKIYDDNTLYYTIEAIKKIKGLYYEELKEFLKSEGCN